MGSYPWLNKQFALILCVNRFKHNGLPGEDIGTFVIKFGGYLAQKGKISMKSSFLNNLGF